MALLITCWDAELPPFILYVSIPSASLSFQAQQIWMTWSCLCSIMTIMRLLLEESYKMKTILKWQGLTLLMLAIIVYSKITETNRGCVL